MQIGFFPVPFCFPSPSQLSEANGHNICVLFEVKAVQCCESEVVIRVKVRDASQIAIPMRSGAMIAYEVRCYVSVVLRLLHPTNCVV